MATLQETIAAAQRRLQQAGIDDPALDTRLLIAHALRCERADLISQSHRELTADEKAAIDRLISRRCTREPVARIIGQREFWGLPFAINEATLEPRPDSETLIEAVLKRTDCFKPVHLLDLGTGTGCLLLALLHSLPMATGLGIDKAPRAIEQATANARQLGLSDRAVFQSGEWLTNVCGSFDVILSNPPYIPSQDIATLAPEVRDFDPRLALDGGADGLAPYRLLIPHYPAYLKENGLAVFEVGVGQAPHVSTLFHQNGFKDIAVIRDLGGIDRVVIARK